MFGIKRKIKIILRLIRSVQAGDDYLFELRSNNPTCNFYKDCSISESTLSRYNVVFDNVILYKVKLGAHTYIQKNTKIFNANIGNFCSIASNVSIGLGKHKVDGLSTHPSFYLKNTPLAKVFTELDEIEVSEIVIVEHDVWIGESAIILDGIKIGTGAIVAAGAVVTKDVEPFSIVGGIPARHIKYRFNDAIQRKLFDLAWWNKSDEWLENNFKKLEDEILKKDSGYS